MQAAEMFADETKAEEWFISMRWPDGVKCPVCESHNVQVRKSRKPQPFRCRHCRKDFSVRTHSIMHGSPLPLSVWGMAIYQLTTNLRGVSSMKLHRDLGITQKTAWHLAHRIRRAWAVGAAGGKVQFIGPVEVDETFIGGRERNKHRSKRIRRSADEVGRFYESDDGKTIVAGVKDRRTNRISAAVVPNTGRVTLHGFVTARTDRNAMVYSDDLGSYRSLPRRHESVRHKVGEYVRGQAHTNGIESFWAVLKRGYKGTYYQMSEKHLNRYVAEFAGRHNSRSVDTEVQMGRIVRGMHRRHLSYARLIA